MSAQVERFSAMRRPASRPSQRLLAAAAAERDGLRRRREDLLQRRDRLREQITKLDAELAELDERDELLSRIGGDAPAPRSAAPTRQADSARPLRGPAIRRAAVRVLLQDPRRPEALHYREWFRLLQQAGYAVAGKDPLAVFLTQISRSPAVRRGSQSGVYELDLTAAVRLRRQLDDRQRKLRRLTAAATPAANLSEVRSQRTQLTQEIDKLEKALEEAEVLLGAATERLAVAG